MIIGSGSSYIFFSCFNSYSGKNQFWINDIWIVDQYISYLYSEYI